MWSKIIVSAVALLAAALFAYLGQRTIAAYGTARQAQGAAEGKLTQLPAVLEANAQAARTAIEARDRVIAANGARDAEIDRLLPLILSARDKVTAYAETDRGRATCLGPERVRDIAADRTALFHPATADATGSDRPGSVPADAAAGPDRREHDQRGRRTRDPAG